MLKVHKVNVWKGSCWNVDVKTSVLRFTLKLEGLLSDWSEILLEEHGMRIKIPNGPEQK